jgi:hypothetical protein
VVVLKDSSADRKANYTLSVKAQERTRDTSRARAPSTCENAGEVGVGAPQHIITLVCRDWLPRHDAGPHPRKIRVR